jgi:D-methionine transport system permease protein
MNFENTRVLEYFPDVIVPAIGETIIMLFFTILLSFTLGTILAVSLVVSNPKGLRPNRFLFKTIDSLTNTVRSFPSLILIVALIPLTKTIVGTSIGIKAAVFPMTIISMPFVIRLVETSLMSVEEQYILAAKSFGASNSQIIRKVMFVEARSILISNLTMQAISVLGLVTIAGTVGAGGLGAVGLAFGYQRFDDIMMYSVVLILLIMVFVLQITGRILYNKSL